MKPINLKCILLACLLLAGCSAAQYPLRTAVPPRAASTNPQTWRMVGYFPSWAPATSKYLPTDIPADSLTHVNYAFVVPNSQGLCAPDNAQSAVNNIPGFQALKKVRPKLQMLISIGGGANLDAAFQRVVQTPENLTGFVTSCLNLMKSWGFDGLDLDWEFSQDQFKQPLTAILAEMRRQVDALGQADGRTYLLTMAAPAGPWGMARLELDKIAPLVDWINLMTYSYYGAWSTSTGFNAPLYTSPSDPQGLSVDSTVHAYLDAGVPANKLVLGVPFYGAAWQGVGATGDGLFQPDGGIYLDGALDYREIAANYLNSFPLHREPTSLAPWLYDEKQGVMISFDDPQSLKEKAAYARKLGLGGMMIWQLAGDDLNNTLLNSLGD
jgi:chitinase